MGEIGYQSGLSEVDTRFIRSLTSEIPFGILVEIYEFLPWRERGNRVFSVGKKIE